MNKNNSDQLVCTTSKIGYAVIHDSLDDLRPQLDCLEELGVNKIYKDIANKIDSERPGLAELVLEIGSQNNLEIYCKSVNTMFCKVEAFVPVAELVIERESKLIFIQDDLVISRENGVEYILLWLDFLEFKVKHHGRRASKKNRKLKPRI